MIKTRFNILLLSAAAIQLVFLSVVQPGVGAGSNSFDQSFGGDGVGSIPFRLIGTERSGLAIQADGQILVAHTIEDEGKVKIALARFHSDGSRDRSFGKRGRL